MSFFCINTYCQANESPEIESLKVLKERLNYQIQSLQDSIKSIDKQIDLLLTQQVFENDDYVETTTKYPTGLYETPKILKLIGSLPKGTKVYVIGYDDGRLLITDMEKKGYVASNYIEKNDLVEKYIDIKSKEAYEIRESKLEEIRQGRIAKRHAEIKSKFGSYGNQVVDNIINNKFWVGMTDEMAIYSLGKANSINRSVYSDNKVREQWVYDTAYLYFVDGKLQSYQLQK